jgi:hypothetical protein
MKFHHLKGECGLMWCDENHGRVPQDVAYLRIGCIKRYDL